MPYLVELDLVFRALADPTRRSIVERLGRGAVSTSELARPFDMALPSFTQHLDVLQRAGLVESSKSGRVRTYRLVRARLDEAERWMAAQRDLWERRLDQLDAFVTDRQEAAADATRRAARP